MSPNKLCDTVFPPDCRDLAFGHRAEVNELDTLCSGGTRLFTRNRVSVMEEYSELSNERGSSGWDKFSSSYRGYTNK